jgi:peptidoglycan/LPS O-acetylase OafA/YrhL
MVTQCPQEIPHLAQASAAPSESRIAGLDGLRALSIAFVLLHHLTGTRNFPLPDIGRHLLGLFQMGSLGVRVFFVISGFLITSLLLAEVRKSGTIALRRFYFRRTLRIFPAYYLYIAVMVVAAGVGVVSLYQGDILHAVTYTVNYHQERAWHLGHAWSLAVEEQFYLLWPALFRRLGESRSRRALAGYICIAPLWRISLGALFPSHMNGIGETFFTTADAIACGCLLALGREQLTSNPIYRRWMDSQAYPLIIPAILLFAALSSSAKFRWLIGSSAQNVLIALLIERVTRSEEGWLPRILNCPPVALLGLCSYSVYLWQQPMLNRNAQDIWFTAFPVNLILCLTLAAASYYCVEKPFLQLRKRLEASLFRCKGPGTNAN